MLIDLTHPLSSDTPVYPGDPKVVINVADTFEQAGYLGHNLSMGTHAGTHIDAPAHMIEGGKTLEQLPLETFVGDVVYVRAENGEFSLADVQSANIQPGCIVVFDTGMSEKFDAESYFIYYPVMSEEVAQYLVEKKVKMVALDTCSADNDEGFPIHKILLGADIPIIENIAHPQQIAGKQARLYALPLRLRTDGSPARVVAEVSDNA